MPIEDLSAFGAQRLRFHMTLLFFAKFPSPFTFPVVLLTNHLSPSFTFSSKEGGNLGQSPATAC
jgi:hypothetical protein